MFVLRRSTDNDQGAVQGSSASILLQHIEGDRSFVRFDLVGDLVTPIAEQDEAFELLLEVSAEPRPKPGNAIWAEWEIADVEDRERFITRARALFATRRQSISSFCFDWLMRRLDRDDRFLVLGVYEDEEGARTLSRGHPAVLAFAEQNPAPYATNVSGFPVFSVVHDSLR
jgi:hypothetical protein